jgi:hypothetical protein
VIDPFALVVAREDPEIQRVEIDSIGMIGSQMPCDPIFVCLLDD